MASKATDVTILFGSMKSGLLNGYYEYVDGKGEAYRGQLVDGQPHGDGLMTNLEKGFMRGTFDQGVFVQGELRWVIDDYLHIGTFLDGQIWIGRGRRQISGGLEEGMFEEGKLNGYGERSVGLVTLIGIFRKGEFWEGEGWLKPPQSAEDDCPEWSNLVHEYRGRVAQGVPCGKGKLLDKDQNVIAEGTFNGWRLVEGKGAIMKDGNIFQGTFKESELQGLGAVVFGDGGFAVGAFEKGRLITGKLLKNWRLSIGSFDKEFRPNGKAKVLYLQSRRSVAGIAGLVPEAVQKWTRMCLSGTNFAELIQEVRVEGEAGFEEGNFMGGLLNGVGESNVGGIYRKGTFKEGKLHGEGIRTTRDKGTEEGRFLEDVWVGIDPYKPNPWKDTRTFTVDSSIQFWGTSWPTGNGRLVYNDHAFEEGEFENGKLKNGLRVATFQKVAHFQFVVRHGLMTGEVFAKNDRMTIVGKKKVTRWNKIDAIFDHKELLPYSYWIADPTKLLDAPPGLDFELLHTVTSLTKPDSRGQCTGFVLTLGGALYQGTFEYQKIEDIAMIRGEVKFLDLYVRVENKQIVEARKDPKGTQDYLPLYLANNAPSKLVMEGLIVASGYFTDHREQCDGIALGLDPSGMIREAFTKVGRLGQGENNGAIVQARLFEILVGTTAWGEFRGQRAEISKGSLFVGNVNGIQIKNSILWLGNAVVRTDNHQPGVLNDLTRTYPVGTIRMLLKEEDTSLQIDMTDSEREEMTAQIIPETWENRSIQITNDGEILAFGPRNGDGSRCFRMVSLTGYLYEGTFQEGPGSQIGDFIRFSSKCWASTHYYEEGQFDNNGGIVEGVKVWPDGWAELGKFKNGFAIPPTKF